MKVGRQGSLLGWGKEGKEDVIVFGAETTLNLYSLASLFELTTLLTGLTYPSNCEE